MDPDQIIAQFHYRQANKRSPNSIEALGDVPVDLQLLSRALLLYSTGILSSYDRPNEHVCDRPSSDREWRVQGREPSGTTDVSTLRQYVLLTPFHYRQVNRRSPNSIKALGEKKLCGAICLHTSINFRLGPNLGLLHTSFSVVR